MDLTPGGYPMARTNWQKARDTAGIKKGAVKKISLSDDLDKWHKTRTRSDSLIALHKASERLRFDSTTYVQLIRPIVGEKNKGKSEAVGKLITEKVAEPARDYETWAKDAIKDLRGAVVLVINAYKIFKSTKPRNYTVLADALDGVVSAMDTHGVKDYSPYYGQVHKRLTAQAKTLRTFDPAATPDADPISAAQKVVADLMKRNGFK